MHDWSARGNPSAPLVNHKDTGDTETHERSLGTVPKSLSVRLGVFVSLWLTTDYRLAVVGSPGAGTSRPTRPPSKVT